MLCSPTSHALTVCEHLITVSTEHSLQTLDPSPSRTLVILNASNSSRQATQLQQQLDASKMLTATCLTKYKCYKIQMIRVFHSTPLARLVGRSLTLNEGKVCVEHVNGFY